MQLTACLPRRAQHKWERLLEEKAFSLSPFFLNKLPSLVAKNTFIYKYSSVQVCYSILERFCNIYMRVVTLSSRLQQATTEPSSTAEALKPPSLHGPGPESIRPSPTG